MKKRIRSLSQVQIIAIGFFITILMGSFLLMLPISSNSGKVTGFLDCLFTSTSATCVTGLIVQDTYLHWSWFGRTVIIMLIQIGGLGFITIGVFFSLLLRRRISLRQRGLVQESVNALHMSGMVKLTKFIIKGTVLIEGIGALLLAFRFVPEYGWKVGIYFSVFHSISAFCNAGFDLMGHQGAYSSLVNYADDIYVNVIIMALIVIGGLGFLVWQDMLGKKFRFKNLELHTKIVMVMTLALVLIPTVIFWILEKNHLLAGMTPIEQVIGAMFSAVTPRTAGFNTIDTAALQPGSKLLTNFLMFIGGSPGSTAGGVKTTTFLVILLYILANLRGRKNCNLFGRRFEDDAIRKATVVFCTNLFLTMTAALIISSMESAAMDDIMLEVFSAMGTVGMSTGITRELGSISLLILIFLMYCGRIGSLTFTLSFFENKKEPPVLNPAEKVRIG